MSKTIFIAPSTMVLQPKIIIGQSKSLSTGRRPVVLVPLPVKTTAKHQK